VQTTAEIRKTVKELVKRLDDPLGRPCYRFHISNYF